MINLDISRIKSIGEYEQIEVLPELIEEIKKGNSKQKKAGAKSIQKLCQKYKVQCILAVPCLFELLDENCEEVREASLLALNQIKEKYDFSRVQIEKLLEIWCNDGLIFNRKVAEIIIKSQDRKLIERKMELTERKNLLRKLKNNYSFDGFYHYTDFENFLKIMDVGKLFCREKATKIGFFDSAEMGIINKDKSKEVKERVRLFFRENTPTTRRNEGIKPFGSDPHMPLPVLLLFKEDIFFHKNVLCANGGCASKHTQITDNIEEIRKFNWDKIFCKRSGAVICEQRVNSRNAEFLYPEELSLENLKVIIFRSRADKRNAIFHLGNNPLFKVDCSKFHNHNNYLLDYEFKRRDGKIYVKLDFWEPKKRLEDGFVLYDKNNKVIPGEVSLYEKLENGRCRTYEIDWASSLETKRVEFYMDDQLSAFWEED